MNIRDLEYLVAVHDVCNFSKAAEMCNVSQPTLSGQLKKLEKDLDASLIERSTRRVLFTKVGESVVEHARNVLNMVEQIQELTSASGDPMSGDVNIGLIPTVGPFLLPTLMPEISEKYPKLNLYLYELQADKLLEKLHKGEIDAAVLTKQDWKHPVDETLLYSEKLMLAVSANNELANEVNPVSCSALKGKPVIMLDDGHCLQKNMMEMCSGFGAKESLRYKATSMDTLLHMVMANKGITLVPELACDKELPGVKFLPLKNVKQQRKIVMVTRKGTPKQEVFQVLAETISNTASSKMQAI